MLNILEALSNMASALWEFLFKMLHWHKSNLNQYLGWVLCLNWVIDLVKTQMSPLYFKGMVLRMHE